MSTLMRKPERGGLREFLNPFEMMRREFEETMSNVWPEGEFALTRGAMPMMDVSETDGNVEIKLDLPGVKPEEIKVEVRGNEVMIHGERKEEKEEKDEKRNFHRMERRWGKFARTVMLPCEVAADKVEANYHNGVLELKLPKREPNTSKTVPVKAL
jgi:HSP20 family protein